jgi:hypothetical protein
MSRFKTWVIVQYSIHQANQQLRSRQKALQIIPPDENPYEIMKAWKTEMIRRYGIDGIQHSDCATPEIQSISLESIFRRVKRRTRRVIYAMFF